MFHIIKSAAIAFFVLFSLGAIVACKPKDEAAKPLRVGMDLSYPPFETISPDGKPTGVSVEIAEALGEYLGRPIRIENIPFVGLIPSLQTGKIDLIISSMTRTEERARSIAFSEPYLHTGLGLLVRKESPIQRPEDLDVEGHKVVVRQGTTGHTWAKENLRHASLIVLEKENAAVLEVAQGKADAFIYDQMSVWKNAQQQPELRAVLQPLQKEAWAIGMRLGDDELLARVNEFLKEFRASGGFERLGEKYLGEQKAAFREQGVPFYF